MRRNSPHGRFRELRANGAERPPKGCHDEVGWNCADSASCAFVSCYGDVQCASSKASRPSSNSTRSPVAAAYQPVSRRYSPGASAAGIVSRTASSTTSPGRQPVVGQKPPRGRWSSWATIAPSGPSRCTNAVYPSASGARVCQRRCSAMGRPATSAVGRPSAPTSSIPLRQVAAAGAT